MEVVYDKEKDILTLDGQPYSGHFVKLILDPLIIGSTYRTVRLPNGTTTARVVINPVGVFKIFQFAGIVQLSVLALALISMIWWSTSLGWFFLILSAIYSGARLVIMAIGEASDNIISEIISHK